MYVSLYCVRSQDPSEVPYQGADSVVMEMADRYKELDLNTREILSVLEVQT